MQGIDRRQILTILKQFKRKIIFVLCKMIDKNVIDAVYTIEDVHIDFKMESNINLSNKEERR